MILMYDLYTVTIEIHPPFYTKKRTKILISRSALGTDITFAPQKKQAQIILIKTDARNKIESIV